MFLLRFKVLKRQPFKLPRFLPQNRSSQKTQNVHLYLYNVCMVSLYSVIFVWMSFVQVFYNVLCDELMRKIMMTWLLLRYVHFIIIHTRASFLLKKIIRFYIKKVYVAFVFIVKCILFQRLQPVIWWNLLLSKMMTITFLLHFFINIYFLALVHAYFLFQWLVMIFFKRKEWYIMQNGVCCRSMECRVEAHDTTGSTNHKAWWASLSLLLMIHS